jgi:hypothetical protein
VAEVEDENAWLMASKTSPTNSMSLTPPHTGEWYMDSGTASHMTIVFGYPIFYQKCWYRGLHGIKVYGTFCHISQLVKNLIFVCEFIINNNCSVEFGPYDPFRQGSAKQTSDHHV